MKRIVSMIIVLFCCNINIYSQGWEWAVSLSYKSELNSEQIKSLITDGTNYYALGHYYGGLNTPGGLLQSNGYNDIFIIKYDAAGRQLWAHTLGGDFYPHFGETDEKEMANGVYDPINNCIYISGSIIGSVVFEPNKVVLPGSRYTWSDPFVAKMDLDGHFLWAKRVTSPAEVEYASCFADKMGNVVMVGQIMDTGTIEGVKLPKGGYIARFDTDGHLKWIQHTIDYNNPSTQFMIGTLAFLGSDMILGGYFNNSVQIDTLTLVSKGEYDGYLMRMDSIGHIKWIKTFGNTAFDAISGVVVDDKNNIYASGTYKDSVNFAGKALKNRDTDFFIAKLDENGNPLWINQSLMQDNTNYYFAGGKLTFDNNGMIYATGTLGGTATFGKYTVSTTNPSDMFLARYNTSGQCLGVRNFGPAKNSCLAVDKTNNVVCGGLYYNTVNIGSYTFTSYQDYAIYIAKSGIITGIHQKNQPVANNLVIYANPNSGKCTLTIPDEFKNDYQLELGIYNNAGRLIQQQSLMLREGKVLINLEAEAKGIYLARLSNGKREYTGKIIFE